MLHVSCCTFVLLLYLSSDIRAEASHPEASSRALCSAQTFVSVPCTERSPFCLRKRVQEATKDHFDMTTLIFSTGGCPSFYSFKRGPGTLFSWLVTENPSKEVVTKDHFASNPRKGNPPDLKTKVDVGKVDVNQELLTIYFVKSFRAS